MNMHLESINSDMFHSFSNAFTKAYAVCYIVSPFLGLSTPLFGKIPTALFLVSIGVGLWIGIAYKIRPLLWVLAVGEAAACVGHYLQIIPWSPVFSNYAYINMALLDLMQSVCLFKILNNQSWQRTLNKYEAWVCLRSRTDWPPIILPLNPLSVFLKIRSRF